MLLKLAQPAIAQGCLYILCQKSCLSLALQKRGEEGPCRFGSMRCSAAPSGVSARCACHQGPPGAVPSAGPHSAPHSLPSLCTRSTPAPLCPHLLCLPAQSCPGHPKPRLHRQYGLKIQAGRYCRGRCLIGAKTGCRAMQSVGRLK